MESKKMVYLFIIKVVYSVVYSVFHLFQGFLKIVHLFKSKY